MTPSPPGSVALRVKGPVPRHQALRFSRPSPRSTLRELRGQRPRLQQRTRPRSASSGSPPPATTEDSSTQRELRGQRPRLQQRTRPRSASSGVTAPGYNRGLVHAPRTWGHRLLQRRNQDHRAQAGLLRLHPAPHRGLNGRRIPSRPTSRQHWKRIILNRRKPRARRTRTARLYPLPALHLPPLRPPCPPVKKTQSSVFLHRRTPPVHRLRLQQRTHLLLITPPVARHDAPCGIARTCVLPD